MKDTEVIRFLLNGSDVSIDTDPLRRLLDVLREDFYLTGVKEGCGEGECGACAVIVDGELINSCILPIGSVSGKTVMSIEGYRETERYRLIADCLAEVHAAQRHLASFRRDRESPQE